MAEKSQPCSLSIETSAIEEQAQEMAELLKTRFPEGISRDLLSDFTRLFLDVVLSDGSAALSADGTEEITIRLNFGANFERLMAAQIGRASCRERV